MENGNIEAFLTAFNRLHETLQDVAGNEDDFFSLLKDLERHPIVHLYKDELHIIRKLRNIIIHEKKNIHYDIAYPSEVAVERLEFVRKQLIQPETAGDHFKRDVFCFDIDDTLERLLYFVHQKRLYQFPIFDESGLTGVISHSGITNWLANHYSDEVIDFSKVFIRDIVEDEYTYFQYEIIHPETSLFDVEKMFSKNLFAGRNQYILLLSDKKEIEDWEDLKGIITPWDLPEVLSLIQFED